MTQRIILSMTTTVTTTVATHMAAMEERIVTRIAEARSRPSSPTIPLSHSTTQSTTQPSTKPVTQPVTQPSTKPVTQPVTQPAHQSTQSATLPEHSVKQEEEQCGTENTAESTAEKASGNKATIIKNTAQLSMIPRQVATQQAENDTAIWPIIPTVLMWYITAMTTQEKDLLRRSQPNHYGYSNWTSADKDHIGRCIFGRIETVRCLVSTSISLFKSFHCGRRFRGMHTTN